MKQVRGNNPKATMLIAVEAWMLHEICEVLDARIDDLENATYADEGHQTDCEHYIDYYKKLLNHITGRLSEIEYYDYQTGEQAA